MEPEHARLHAKLSQHMMRSAIGHTRGTAGSAFYVMPIPRRPSTKARKMATGNSS
jgi:hypothetical protein